MVCVRLSVRDLKNFWGQAKFGRAVAPLGTPLAPPLLIGYSKQSFIAWD